MYKLVNLKYFYCRDFESLNPREIKQNNKTAFDAAASLGITRIIEPADMVCSALLFFSVFTAIHNSLESSWRRTSLIGQSTLFIKILATL